MASLPALLFRTRRQVFVGRSAFLLRHQVIAATARNQLADIGVRIAKIAERARAHRAGGDTGRDATFLGQVRVVDLVHTERAFLHDARILIILPGAIGAGPGTELASDAGICVHQNNAVFFALVGGAGRADGDAGRIVAMQAAFREMDHASAGLLILHLETVDAIEPHTGRISAIRVRIGHRGRMSAAVPFLAVDGAGMAADTDIEVNDQPELFLRGGLGKRRHSFSFLCRSVVWLPWPGAILLVRAATSVRLPIHSFMATGSSPLFSPLRSAP